MRWFGWDGWVQLRGLRVRRSSWTNLPELHDGGRVDQPCGGGQLRRHVPPQRCQDGSDAIWPITGLTPGQTYQNRRHLAGPRRSQR